MEANHPEHAETASETKQPTPTDQTSKATDTSGPPSSEQPSELPVAMEDKKEAAVEPTSEPQPAAPSVTAPSDAKPPDAQATGSPENQQSQPTSGEAQPQNAPAPAMPKPRVSVKVAAPVKAKAIAPQPEPQPEPVPSAASATEEEWVRPLTFWERVKAVTAALLAKIPPQVRLGIGIAAVPIGATLGAFAAFGLIRVNYNGVVLPSALGGILCGLLSGRRSLPLGIYSAVVGLLAGFLVEYYLAPPELAEEDLAYYVRHLNQIPRMQVIHIVIGAIIGFFFGLGRGGAEKEATAEEEPSPEPAKPVLEEQPSAASPQASAPVAVATPAVRAKPALAENKPSEPASTQESGSAADAPAPAAPDGQAAEQSAAVPPQESQPAAPAPEADANPVPSTPKEEEKKP